MKLLIHANVNPECLRKKSKVVYNSSIATEKNYIQSNYTCLISNLKNTSMYTLKIMLCISEFGISM